MTTNITQIPKLPPRKPEAHKGDFGKVLIVGGSQSMAGAPALAAMAALRSGAGLVRVAVPQSIQPTVAQLVPCATTIGYTPECLSKISQACQENDSIVFGPGMGQDPSVQTILEMLVNQCDAPLLIDADGLNVLAQKPIPLKPNTILTPHPGEMNRLWPAWFSEPLPTQREVQAEKLASRTNAIVILKGHQTVVTDGEQTYINNTGNPGLATGGTGDVLSGTLGALLALGGQKKALPPLHAAILGVWAHGRAADLAVERFGQIGLIASDLPEQIGKILSNL